MICARVDDVAENDFIELLRKTRDVILKHFKTNPAELKKIKAVEFETLVCENAKKAAKGTIFEGKIEQTGLHAFPDIIAKKYYGIEVKTTTADKWVSTGNSVLESTRQDGVERIYLFFAKFGGAFDVKYRPYQECLYEIAVTHSPRYQINMDLEEGETVFAKMNIRYDDLRRKENPIAYVKNYYRGQLEEGEELWWIDQDDDARAVSPIIKPYKDLDAESKEKFIAEALILFPEIFGSSSVKFERVAVYLITRYNVVSANLRDYFTAGGQVQVIVRRKKIKLPRVFYNMYVRTSLIKSVIRDIDEDTLKYFWRTDKISENRLTQWKKIIKVHHIDNGATLTAADVFEAGLANV
ncbi:MAG: hypothetical protein KKB82_04715 [Candidatus Omnitrophica bacterium]|nr:hypothetical protein [Candidatus Omnitrophota bacterium]MBU1925206.1 hypothetical protein [Candidatus Omnitrophota bacterium]